MQAEIEKCFEAVTARKFERLAEIKQTYDVLISKEIVKDDPKQKVAMLREKKEAKLKQVQEELEAEKRSQIAAIKASIEARKKDLQKIKDSKLEALQS